MKIILGTLFLCFLTTALSAQGIFTSIEQAKYLKGDTLTYIGGSHHLVEISFHTKQGYILLKNKDTNFENYYVNVVPGEQPNTWRGYSKITKQACLFSFITNSQGMCIVIDDKTVAHFLKVYKAKSNSSKK